MHPLELSQKNQAREIDEIRQRQEIQGKKLNKK